jgi:Protein of unknown function (DUF3617)
MLHPLPRQFLFLAIATLAFAPPAFSQAPGPDELWEVTTKMEMPGMPMAMPAQTNRVCVEKGNDEALLKGRDNCRITDRRRSGNTVTFSMACTGRDAMTGTGSITFTADGYDGSMQMKGSAEGRSIEMSQKMSGRKVGTCTRS